MTSVCQKKKAAVALASLPSKLMTGLIKGLCGFLDEASTQQRSREELAAKVRACTR
jgi:hypothetical protein